MTIQEEFNEFVVQARQDLYTEFPELTTKIVDIDSVRQLDKANRKSIEFLLTLNAAHKMYLSKCGNLQAFEKFFTDLLEKFAENKMLADK